MALTSHYIGRAQRLRIIRCTNRAKRIKPSVANGEPPHPCPISDVVHVKGSVLPRSFALRPSLFRLD